MQTPPAINRNNSGILINSRAFSENCHARSINKTYFHTKPQNGTLKNWGYILINNRKILISRSKLLKIIETQKKQALLAVKNWDIKNFKDFQILVNGIFQGEGYIGGSFPYTYKYNFKPKISIGQNASMASIYFFCLLWVVLSKKLKFSVYKTSENIYHISLLTHTWDTILKLIPYFSHLYGYKHRGFLILKNMHSLMKSENLTNETITKIIILGYNLVEHSKKRMNLNEKLLAVLNLNEKLDSKKLNTLLNNYTENNRPLSVLFMLGFILADGNFLIRIRDTGKGWGVYPRPLGENPTLQIHPCLSAAGGRGRGNKLNYLYYWNTTFYSVRIKQNNPLNLNIYQLNYYLVYIKINYICSYNQTNQFRFSSTAVLKSNDILNPWFVTGFVDGEGSFQIGFVKDQTRNIGWRVQLCFSIEVHHKDIALLVEIKKYLDVGRIYKGKADSVRLLVISKEDLAKVIYQFNKFPLLTNKQLDFKLFKMVFDLMQKKEHLTKEGLNKIVGIKEQSNWGLSLSLSSAFPNRIVIQRPLVKDQTIENPNWLVGFTSAEGCFHVAVSKSNAYSTGYMVQLEFAIVQHSRDSQLLISFIKYLDCGHVNKYRDSSKFRVRKFDDLTNKIIPLFKKYNLEVIKNQDFSDFCKVAELMKEKKHLTNAGLEEIIKIKAGMNRGRKLN